MHDAPDTKPTRLRPAALPRREFLATLSYWASASLLAAPSRGLGCPAAGAETPPHAAFHSLLEAGDDRLIPRYRQVAPLDEAIRRAEPGLDAFISEKYAAEIEAVLAKWSAELCQSPPSFASFESAVSSTLQASSLRPAKRQPLRPMAGLEVYRNQFLAAVNRDRATFLSEFRRFVGVFAQLTRAEFNVTAISVAPQTAGGYAVHTRIRYDLVGQGIDFFRGQRVGDLELEWESGSAGVWRVRKWQALQETESRASSPAFVDVTGHALGHIHSYQEQLLPGVDHWRTLLDGASRIDVYGNNGIAVGDVDGDGLDDLYVCQPAGLPNRLYRNRGDGSFEDITEKAGAGVLDNTPCALFLDLRNSGRQDLIVVCVDGPLLFLNQGDSRFEFKPAAFHFAQPPQGTFTGAAAADYDRDGLLDVYFCIYSYYRGLNQYQYPSPYYDARNGPPNFLMHNQGDATFKVSTLICHMARFILLCR